MKQKIAILIGTRRQGANSLKVAQHIHSLAENHFEVTFIDPSTEEYKIEDDHQTSPKYKQAVKEAAGFILVFPEYNHSYPGTLKSMLDGAFSEYTLKPFLLVGVSDGIFGGARATESVLPIIRKFGGYPLQRDVYVTEVTKKLNATGEISDPSLVETIESRLEQLLQLVEKFNQIR